MHKKMIAVNLFCFSFSKIYTNIDRKKPKLKGRELLAELMHSIGEKINDQYFI